MEFEGNTLRIDDPFPLTSRAEDLVGDECFGTGVLFKEILMVFAGHQNDGPARLVYE